MKTIGIHSVAQTGKMQEVPYTTIPEVPESTNAANALSRLVDGLGFRYRWTTEGLTANEGSFKPAESSRDLMGLMHHIHRLASTASDTFGGKDDTAAPPETFEEVRLATLKLYADLGERLRSMSDAQIEASIVKMKGGQEFPFWFIINGQIADALTHVGQITSWRRISGNPQPSGVDVSIGKKS